ncbi:MAG: alpha/beta hydrolase [Pseudomonadota bacterium]
MLRPLLLAALALLPGCLLPPVTHSARPEVPLGPWEPGSVHSEATGLDYAYLYLPGPGPGAPAVVLLPGGIFDERFWLYTADLARRYQVYALQWPTASSLYHGRVEDLGDSAADFLGALGVERLDLVGVSAGAYAAIDLTTRHPEIQVDHLVLISAVMFAITPEESRKRSHMGRLGASIDPDLRARVVQRQALRAPYDAAPGLVQQLDTFWVRPASWYDQVFGMTANQADRPQDTRSISCPVLILQGDADEIMPVRLARLSPSVFQDARYEEFPGWGHAMVFAHGPAIAARILAFTAERGPSSAPAGAAPGG